MSDGLLEVRNISVSIHRSPQAVYAFASNGANLPRWASGLGASVREVDGDWIAEGPLGRVTVRFAAPNDFGVLDHDVVLSSGATIHNPMRVVPNGSGSTVIFTLLRSPGVSEAKLAQDAAWVEKDLTTLKGLLEQPPEKQPPSKQSGPIEVLFVAGFGPIASEMTATRKLYMSALGIAFKEEADGYLHTEALKGARSFAVWPLSQAALSCFGNDSWSGEHPVPQAWLELDVDSVETATAELESRGYRMLVKNKKEPWGQTVSRFLAPEGLLVGVTCTPSMRDTK